MLWQEWLLKVWEGKWGLEGMGNCRGTVMVVGDGEQEELVMETMKGNRDRVDMGGNLGGLDQSLSREICLNVATKLFKSLPTLTLFWLGGYQIDTCPAIFPLFAPYRNRVKLKNSISLDPITFKLLQFQAKPCHK